MGQSLRRGNIEKRKAKQKKKHEREVPKRVEGRFPTGLKSYPHTPVVAAARRGIPCADEGRAKEKGSIGVRASPKRAEGDAARARVSKGGKPEEEEDRVRGGRGRR